MKARLHHVGIAVRDLDVSIPIYERLYDTKFRRAGAAISGPSGMEVAACWRVGIELTSPIAGSQHPNAKMLRDFLDTRGEGVYALAHVVDDFDHANATAQDMRLPLILQLALSQQEIDQELGGAFDRFEETVFNALDKPGMKHLVAFNLLQWKQKA